MGECVRCDAWSSFSISAAHTNTTKPAARAGIAHHRPTRFAAETPYI